MAFPSGLEPELRGPKSRVTAITLWENIEACYYYTSRDQRPGNRPRLPLAPHPGFEPGLSRSRGGRVANYTSGEYGSFTVCQPGAALVPLRVLAVSPPLAFTMQETTLVGTSSHQRHHLLFREVRNRNLAALAKQVCPERDSNPRIPFRKRVVYPLTYQDLERVVVRTYNFRYTYYVHSSI